MSKKFFLVTTVPITLNFFQGQIQVFKKLFDVSLVSSPGIQLENLEASEKVSTHTVTMERNIAPLEDVKSLIGMIKLFKKEKPFLVHGNTPKGGLISMLAAYICRVQKRVYCIHGLRYQGNSGLKGFILRTMEKTTCALATDLVTVSFGVAKTLSEDKITSKEVHVIANGSINGIDPNYFNPKIEFSVPENLDFNTDKNSIVFGFVGRLVKDKGIVELVNAFVDLNKKHKNIKLLLVGNTEDLLDPLPDSTKNHILNSKDIFSAGFQKDIRPYLKLMNVFTFPSYREGFGVSIMEAAAMGVPSISSNISGCNEIISDGYNGKLIPPKSTSHLQDAMESFIKNPELIKKYASVSRKSVLEKYDQKIVWNAIEEFYTKLS
ncbi:glycosyltransferase family 4 protein [Seonamhaeicola sp. ML3]|uniref:glycosyltransferase family 4 protein n=1 Tax=Seonamhaeicola sp. ML3 TaxID=2937786 RepID=UPI0020102DF6|nr:glycosyltransferase family 4 protein [Seonamhaeicola sp. ML3]